MEVNGAGHHFEKGEGGGFGQKPEGEEDLFLGLQGDNRIIFFVDGRKSPLHAVRNVLSSTSASKFILVTGSIDGGGDGCPSEN